MYHHKLKTLNLKVEKLTQRLEKLNLIRDSTLNEISTNENSLINQINCKHEIINDIKSQISGMKPNRSLNDLNKIYYSFDEEVSVNYSRDCKRRKTIVNKNMNSIDSNINIKKNIQEENQKEKIDFQLREVKFNFDKTIVYAE